MKRRLLLLVTLACAGCAAIETTNTNSVTPAQKPTFGTWGVDTSAIDNSVKPGDDFFLYANGNWVKTAKIPPDRASTGSFQELRILSEKRMNEIVDMLAAKPYDQLSVDEKKLRDLYDAFLDQKQIDSRGLGPAKNDLAYLQGLKSHSAVARAMGSIRMIIDSPFAMSIGVDGKNPNVYSIDLQQGGLGMPDRDYYLKSDKAIVTTQDAYKKYLMTMLGIADVSNAEARAVKVYDLEARIAKAQWKNGDTRDPKKTYNPMTISTLKKLAPQFDWTAFFTEAHVPLTSPTGERGVIVAEKSAFPKLAKIFADTPVSVWRDYLTVHYLHSFAAILPTSVDDADFDFYGRVIAGSSQQLPRAMRGVHLLDNNLGEALGKLYVAKYFPPSSKTKADKLVANLLKAFDADIRALPWMTEATRQEALKKLHKIKAYLGYPDKWKDYAAYDVARNDLIGDVQRGKEFEWNRQLKRIDQPVDKSEWGATPQTVNAYYSPWFNKIVFPAAILQPPFFDPNADDAVNYGGIGAVIGHEISHGFDDQGAQYDGDGVLRNWWTADDLKAFKAATDRLVAQYDQFEPLPGVHVNGRFTLGENIGDLSGLTIALKAYHLSLGGKPGPVIDGYTADQRFFLSYGQIWRGKYRDSALRARLLSDAHSPAMDRAKGAPRNVDAWYTAFDIKPGDKMYIAPDDRVRLW